MDVEGGRFTEELQKGNLIQGLYKDKTRNTPNTSLWLTIPEACPVLSGLCQSYLGDVSVLHSWFVLTVYLIQPRITWKEF